MKVGVIGSTGLVGSRLVEILRDTFDIATFNSSTGTDITNSSTLSSLANDSSISHIVLLAAKTDVDGCEQDKSLGEGGAAWKINVEGARNVAKICKNTGKKLLYVSTDFVFDGEKLEGESYTEDDIPNPINWYGFTKLKGEEAVQESGAEYVIARLAYPYRSTFDNKKDFMRAIRDRLASGIEVTAVGDHIFRPTFIDDFAFAIQKLIEQNAAGIYHVVGSESITPYEAAQEIATTFGLDRALIIETTRAKYFANKANRPFNLSLENAKIGALGVEMRTFEEGLQEVKKQTY